MLRWVYCWKKNEEGATAVEFALVSVPFIFLLLGIIEISLMFVAGANLNSGTNDASRLIRTGQAQQAPGDPENVFRDRLCERVDVFLDCSKLQYEVIPMDNFTDYSQFEATYDEEGNLNSQGFDAGGSSDVILIRVSYRYQLILPMIGNIFSDGPGMTKHLLSTVVLQNEPYDINEEVENM